MAIKKGCEKERSPSGIMSPHAFKHGMLRLARHDPSPRSLVDAETWARHLAARYIDADEDAQRDCSRMLRKDLRQLTGDSPKERPPE